MSLHHPQWTRQSPGEPWPRARKEHLFWCLSLRTVSEEGMEGVHSPDPHGRQLGLAAGLGGVLLQGSLFLRGAEALPRKQLQSLNEDSEPCTFSGPAN